MKQICLALLMLWAAAVRAQEATPDPPYSPPPPPPPARQLKTPEAPPPAERPRPASRESLFVESTFQSLTSDRRAWRAGDLVTVLVYENATASSSADTGAARDAAVGVNVARTVVKRTLDVGTNNDFTGSARTQRAGRILAQLTVSVQEVSANRDLVLGGEQVLEINGEKQLIRLEGRARPQDIGEGNTVVSTKLADARITFVGDGVVAERQQPGWWHRLLTALGW